MLTPVLDKLVLSNLLSLMLSYCQYLCQSLYFGFIFERCYGGTKTNGLKYAVLGLFFPLEKFQSFNSASSLYQMRYQTIFYSKQ